MIDTTPGQCLACGGRGGYPGARDSVILCYRCKGTGRDPKRGTDWYWDYVLPLQRAGWLRESGEPGTGVSTSVQEVPTAPQKTAPVTRAATRTQGPSFNRFLSHLRDRDPSVPAKTPTHNDVAEWPLVVALGARERNERLRALAMMDALKRWDDVG